MTEGQYKSSIFGRKEENGDQEVMLIVRLLRQIIKDLLADPRIGPRFKNCQFLSFEMHERNGVSIFGVENGGVWCEKTNAMKTNAVTS
jgi:hypothetical protein